MTRLPRPEVVFLDVGDTLVRPDPSWSGVYIAALADHGIHVSEAALERAFAAAMTSEYWSGEGPYEATEAASWARIVGFDQLVLTALGYPDQPQEVFRAIESRFGAHASWHVFPDVLPALDALRAAGLRLAVISNWVWGAPELLHELELAGHFESLVISARVGYSKPSAAIFEHALRVTGVSPDRAVHVGDQYRADILGARSVGITGVLLERRGRDLDALGVPAAEQPSMPLIRDLGGLLELLDIAVATGTVA